MYKIYVKGHKNINKKPIWNQIPNRFHVYISGKGSILESLSIKRNIAFTHLIVCK